MIGVEAAQVGAAQKIRTIIIAGRIGLGVAMMADPTRATRL